MTYSNGLEWAAASSAHFFRGPMLPACTPQGLRQGVRVRTGMGDWDRHTRLPPPGRQRGCRKEGAGRKAGDAEAGPSCGPACWGSMLGTLSSEFKPDAPCHCEAKFAKEGRDIFIKQSVAVFLLLNIGQRVCGPLYRWGWGWGSRPNLCPDQA